MQPVTDWADLDSRFKALRSRRKALQPSAKKADRNAFIRSLAVETGALASDVEYWIVVSPLSEDIERIEAAEAAGKLPAGFCASIPSYMNMKGALCGYVAFPKRHCPLPVPDMFEDNGILEYIPVHGGVTYAVKDATAAVFGFDTAHFNSSYVPRTERPWIAWQCRVLYEGLLLASKLNDKYRRAQTNEARARIVQPLLDLIPEEDLGTGAMLKVLMGKL